MPAVAAPSVPPFVAVLSVSESEPFVFVAVLPVSESEPFVFVAILPVSESESPVANSLASESESRAATVPSAVTRVVPIDELSRLLVIAATTPAFIVGERNGGQSQVDDYRQGGSKQNKP